MKDSTNDGVFFILLKINCLFKFIFHFDYISLFVRGSTSYFLSLQVQTLTRHSSHSFIIPIWSCANIWIWSDVSTRKLKLYYFEIPAKFPVRNRFIIFTTFPFAGGDKMLEKRGIKKLFCYR